ncbi:MAG: proton-conducting transporter membrane subunit, partial [Halanaerobiales bacterium]
STAILAGLVGKAYIIGLVKILFTVYNLDFLSSSNLLSLILFLSVLAILIGSIVAIKQDNMKRMLAYSSVTQIGYIFLGVGLVTEQGLTGGLLHIFNHALIKTLLFLAAGVIIYKTGIKKLSDFRGVGYRYPLTMVFFSVAALSMVGIPPLNGFMSKYLLALGTLEAEKPILLAVILTSSFLNGIYYFPIIIRSFFRSEKESVYQWEFSRLDKKAWIPMMILMTAIIFFGVFPNIPLNFIENIVADLLV